MAGSSSSGEHEAGKGRPAAREGSVVALAAAGSAAAPDRATRVSDEVAVAKSPTRLPGLTGLARGLDLAKTLVFDLRE